MLKRDVVLGKHYAVKWHDGRFTVIQIIDESRYGGYNALNLRSGRNVRIKSAAKLRYEVRNIVGTRKWEKVA
jgi:hypothetical protein